MNVGTRPGIRFGALLIAIAMVAVAAPVVAQDGVAGKWRTEVESMQGTAVLILNLEQDATGRWLGTIRASTDPDEIVDLEAVDVEDGRVRFRTSTDVPDQDITIRSDYELRLNPVDDMLKGTVTATLPGMGSRDMSLEFERVVERAGADDVAYVPERPLIGAWSAQPDDDDETREILMEILPDGDDYQGTLTDTGVDETVELRDLSISEQENTISYNFRFEGAPFMSSFWGRYDEENDEVRGSMSIGGRSQPLDFERTSPGPESVMDEFATEREPLPVKHPGKFAVTARLAWWQPLYVLKEKVRNINDITTGQTAFDFGARYHIIDYLAVQARYVRGGVGFDTNETNLALFHPETGPQGNTLSEPITGDSELTLDGFEFNVIGYLGQSLFPESKFNPYVIATAGRTDWTVAASGRGSDPIAIAEEPLEGTDWTFGGGLGTEYLLNDRFGLELEWLWAYTLTEDETLWNDVTEQWTNQHVFRFSLGGIYWF